MAIDFHKDIDLHDNKAIRVGRPRDRTDAATKGYIDDLIEEVAPRPVTSYTTALGNGEDRVFVVEHNLGTLDVRVTLYSAATGEEVDADVVHNSPDTVLVEFGSPPITLGYRCVVHGVPEL